MLDKSEGFPCATIYFIPLCNLSYWTYMTAGNKSVKKQGKAWREKKYCPYKLEWNQQQKSEIISFPSTASLHI